MKAGNKVRRPVQAGDYGMDIIQPTADHQPSEATAEGVETDGKKTLSLWSN